MLKKIDLVIASLFVVGCSQIPPQQNHPSERSSQAKPESTKPLDCDHFKELVLNLQNDQGRKEGPISKENFYKKFGKPERFQDSAFIHNGYINMTALWYRCSDGVVRVAVTDWETPQGTEHPKKGWHIEFVEQVE